MPKRFKPKKRVLITDKIMTQVIKIGGLSLILAVLGIFVFIFWQTLPLFKSPVVTLTHKQELQKTQKVKAVITDEWNSRVYFFDKLGVQTYVWQNKKLNFEKTLSYPKPQAQQEDPSNQINEESNLEATPVIQPKWVGFNLDFLSHYFLLGSNSGAVVLAQLETKPNFETGQRKIKSNVEQKLKFDLLPLGQNQNTIAEIEYIDLNYAHSETEKLAGFIVRVKNQKKHRVFVAKITQAQSLLATGDLEVSSIDELSSQIKNQAQKIVVSSQGRDFLVLDDQQILYNFRWQNEGFINTQTIEFDKTNPVEAIQFINGGASFYVMQKDGSQALYSQYRDPQKNQLTYNLIGKLEKTAPPFHAFSPANYNRSFLVASGQNVSLHYATTKEILWQQSFDKPIEHVFLSPKYDRITLFDGQHLYAFQLNDPHPEAGFTSFFKKIWYEGASEPAYTWQSTGGTDAFEPKLSLIPLIIGTLKGTFYALIFAVPIALLAGIYASQFLHRRILSFVKPAMEIMASLPSVILGFLAALWFAPLIENYIPSLLICLLGVPLAVFIFGSLWSRLPILVRKTIPSGYEILVIMPIILICGWLLWQLGPVVENWLFVAKDPETGKMISDFRLWWPQFTGTSFEQRNSLVVGFAMGFAVIPIIFTITEDSLSQVPLDIRSAALACGATPWQTTARIVLPTAAAGILSAIIIGTGRAIGETMIVLMATGNTPIMDLNIFSGMRTLSANIAVELPEAPVHGTLYRTLFLGALVLFLMTFVMNTLADYLRQYLRKKYKTL